MRFPLFPLLAAGLVAPAVHATTVIPSSLEQLVARAELVVRATVTHTRCEWRGDGEDRHIVTVVTVSIHEALVGSAPAEIALEFLGGEIDGQWLRVEGQPHFTVGDDDFLFVAGNGRTFCPLVGMMFGRYLVAKDDAGRELVARENGVPLTDVKEIATPLNAGPVAHVLAATQRGQAMTPGDFSAAIRDVARRLGRTDVQAARQSP